MKKQAITGAIIAFFLLVPLAMAAPFSVTPSIVTNEILPNQTAEFLLTINNFGAGQQRYQVSSIDPNWVVRARPSIVTVDGSSSGETTILLNPKSTVPFGSHGITLSIRNLDSGETTRETVAVAVRNFGQTIGQYQPSVSTDITLPSPIDPRNPVDMVLRFSNRNPLNIQDMTVRIRGEHFNREFNIDLLPLGDHTEGILFELDPLTEPGTYSYSAQLRWRDLTVANIQRSYVVGEFASINREEQEQSFLFKTTERVLLTNDGNTDRLVTVMLPANHLQRPFTSSNHDMIYEEGRYVWEVVVPAGASAEVVFTKNYRWFIATVVVALLSVFLYFRLRSPVLMIKEARGVSGDEGMSDLKVRLFVKNRSNKLIQGVQVFDKIPSIASLQQGHALGSIKPSKVTNVKSGTMLQWDIDVLEPYEERIITYVVESKLKIIGRMSLPLAKTKFDTPRGQERLIKSTNLLLVNAHKKR